MNDEWAKEFWDEYIRKKFSNPEKRLYNINITKLYKVYDNPSKFWGHIDKDWIVKVSYWKHTNNIYKLGISHAETYFDADYLELFDVHREVLRDPGALELLKHKFKWTIQSFFDFCD